MLPENALEIVLNYAQTMIDDGRGGTILQEAVDTLRPTTKEQPQ